MAQVPYDPVSQTQPDTVQPVDPYRRVYVNPDQFGAQIGQAVEGLGKQVSNLGNIWGNVQADDATNNFFDQATKIRNGFTNLSGQDALNAQKNSMADMNDAWNQTRSGLGTLESRMKFDESTRRIKALNEDAMTNHANQQGRTFANDVNKSTFQNALTGIAGAPTDPIMTDYWRNKAQDAAMKNLQLQGLDSPETRQAKMAEVDQAIAKTRVEALEPSSPSHAMQVLEENKTALGTDYQPLHDRLQAKAYKDQANQNFNQISSDAGSALRSQYTQGNGTQAPNAAPASFSNGVDASAGVLRHYEGFRPGAYWDVNHWRVGYGSDTVTKPDGTVETVSQNTQITPADAERDLQRRVRDTQNKIVIQAGPEAWGQLNAGQQAALTSMAYNYGSLPYDVSFALRGGGGPQAVAAAILNHQNDNNGVNSQRRMAEAKAMTGGQMPSGLPLPSTWSGPASGGGQVPPEFRGQGVIADVSQPQTSAPESPEDPAAVASPAAYGADQERQSRASTAEDLNAEIVRRIGASDAPMEVKTEMFRMAEMNFRMAQIAAEQDTKAKKQHEDQTTNQIYNVMDKGSYTDAYQAANQALDKGDIDDKKWDTLTQLIQRRSGQEDPKTLGNSYQDIFSRILLPQDDPNRIKDVSQIYQAELSGQLTSKGTGRLKQVMNDISRPDEYGLQRRVSSVFDYAKEKLDFSQDFGTFKIRDPKGAEYMNDFTQKFISQMDRYKEKDPTLSGFPGFDRKNIDQLISETRPRQDFERDKLLSSQQQVGDAQGTDPKAIPAPQGVQPDAWVNVVGSPAMVMGQNGQPARMTTDQWSQYVGRLVANPRPAAIAAFDRKFPGHDGASILGLLGVDVPRPIIRDHRDPVQLPGAQPAEPVGTVEPPMQEQGGMVVQPGQPMPGMAVSP